MAKLVPPPILRSFAGVGVDHPSYKLSCTKNRTYLCTCHLKMQTISYSTFQSSITIHLLLACKLSGRVEEWLVRDSLEAMCCVLLARR